MTISGRIKRFFFPSLNRGYLRRVIFIGLSSYLIFSYLLIPLHIEGQSMEPTYHDGSFNFCWRLKYIFTPIERFDVVTVRFTGRSVMLLKRVVGLPGDTLEFREGILYINGKQVVEPYVQNRLPWNLAPRTIADEHVYVVGDNRSTVMSRHRFGQVKIDRIAGGVIF
ncbi:MAG TPA: signal peptidase I [Desulfobacterales bacterium]|nr:signal peptidase I [Desulfobacterales bacterium]HIP38036.1 signal peptidase I [Desulfocapsa sulfexigens]